MVKKVDSKEIGLEIALIAGKYFLKSDDLHYGLWPEGLEVRLANLPEAQANHSSLIISHIPDGAKTILDVGSGSGAFARQLIEMGYQVDCVSPSVLLARHVREMLEDRGRVFECRFEDLETEKTYDLILFSESFQYVKLSTALDKSLALLNPGGSLLICDFFKTDAPGKNVHGGGHRLTRFYEVIAGRPFKLIEDIDITSQAAPNMTIINDVLMNVGHPVWDLIFRYLDSNFSYVSRFVHWKYKGKLDKIDRKYFSGERNAENFSLFKSYRLLLYQKESRPSSSSMGEGSR